MCIVCYVQQDLMKIECIFSLNVTSFKGSRLTFRLIGAMVRIFKPLSLLLDKFSISLSLWKW
jgi:hypothetical protein